MGGHTFRAGPIPPTRKALVTVHTDTTTNPAAEARSAPRCDRDDAGFSLAQVIVTMIIVGILTAGVGFTVFSFIGQARETVLSSNVRTAAEAVQTVISLNPQLRNPAVDASNNPTGQPSPELLAELTATAPLTWNPVWEMDAALTGPNAEPNVVRIQMIHLAAASGAVVPSGSGAAAIPPSVRWVLGHGDAVRVQARSSDGSWACALIVLRPDWTAAKAANTTTGATAVSNAMILNVEGRLRGVWYDAGAAITGAGLHNCSPVGAVDAESISTAPNSCPAGAAAYGNCAAGDRATNAQDALPSSTSQWNVRDAAGPPVVNRTFERSVTFGD